MFNKTAIITGGNGQVARALVEKLGYLNYNIILLVRKDTESMTSVLKKFSGNHKVILCDVTKESDLKKALDDIVPEYPKCDLLVNAAGINKKVDNSDLQSFSLDLYDQIMDTNFKGTFLTIRCFLDLLKNSNDPLIVNISSTAATGSRNNNLIYAAAKNAVNSLTISLSRSLAPIRVISIAPGVLENPTSGLVKPENFNNFISKEIPLARVGTGEDIANSIVSMIDCKYITGQCIVVDGGKTV